MEDLDKETGLSDIDLPPPEYAAKKLAATTRSQEKMASRAKQLAENPESRIRVNPARLQEIIDYVEFKCHPQSSVARDEAIAGSDIDLGLVILSQEVPLDGQLRFIEELRHQGFSAYHPIEAAAGRTALEEFKATTDSAFSTSQGREALVEVIKQEFSVIEFMTQAEINQLIAAKPRIKALWVYWAGYRIPDSISTL